MNLAGSLASGRAFIALMLLAAAGIAINSQYRLDQITNQKVAKAELLYFPSSGFTRAAAFGYTNLVSDWIWLRVIQYYGQHSLSDREYKYLGHMFDLLTSLAPRFKSAYNFGALLLATDAEDAKGAMDLLTKGMFNNPRDWSIPFTKGFINYVYIGDYREAARWFAISSRMPEAPEMAGRFAAFAMERGGDLKVARALWLEVYHKSHNQTEKDIALRAVMDIEQRMIIDKLGAALALYRQQRGSNPQTLSDLVSAGYIPEIPDDPLGGRFILDATGSRVVAIGGKYRNPPKRGSR